MTMTPLEKNYMVKDRAELQVNEHGSIDNAIRHLKAELGGYEDLWSMYSSDCLGHGITCTSLIIDWLERQKKSMVRELVTT